jgi:hypothetical protein
MGLDVLDRRDRKTGQQWTKKLVFLPASQEWSVAKDDRQGRWKEQAEGSRRGIAQSHQHQAGMSVTQ